MQTILGAGGAIGVELAKSLAKYPCEIRLAGRNPKKVNDTDSLFVANLTKREEVHAAVKGSEVVYPRWVLSIKPACGRNNGLH